MTCYGLIGGVISYFDSHHLTSTYSRSLAGYLGAATPPHFHPSAASTALSPAGLDRPFPQLGAAGAAQPRAEAQRIAKHP